MLKIIYSLFLFAAITLSADPFKDRLIDDVRLCVEERPEILEILETLRSKGSIVETGGDDLRLKFVYLQGCIEHVLACAQELGDITVLSGAIHTPMPATPLCTVPERDPSDLLDPSTCGDVRKLTTVRSRAKVIREYLAKGGTLYVVYPKDGLGKRSAAQQTIYRETLAQYPERLIDSPLPIDELQPELIGATYVFCGRDGNAYAFSIKAPQANDIRERWGWGLWFGSMQEPGIQERVKEVAESLLEAMGPDFRPHQES